MWWWVMDAQGPLMHVDKEGYLVWSHRRVTAVQISISWGIGRVETLIQSILQSWATEG